MTRNSSWLYESDEYWRHNPSFFEEDTDWKVSNIKPLIDRYTNIDKKDRITLLDVGGGSGRILREIADYLRACHNVIVTKYMLDLSPKALETQKRENPDFVKTLNEDIRKTSLGAKEIDLTLMIDVLEHVDDPERALEELRRISHFVIFKIPMESNLCYAFHDMITRGRSRRTRRQEGHVNQYNYWGLTRQIRSNCGQIRDTTLCNLSQCYMNQPSFKRRRFVGQVPDIVGNLLGCLHPILRCVFVVDMMVCLVECSD
jgi:SAM-dependent methyltransferase